MKLRWPGVSHGPSAVYCVVVVFPFLPVTRQSTREVANMLLVGQGPHQRAYRQSLALLMAGM